MSSKHSKGPWRAEEQLRLIADEADRPICYFYPQSNNADVGNAHLIAAAPDLLEACEAVAEDVCSSLCPSKWRTDSGQPHSAQCGQLRAAIKKARTP